MLTIFRSLRKFFWAKGSGFRGLSPGYELTCAQSAPYEYLRDLRALRGEGLFSFGCGLAALCEVGHGVISRLRRLRASAQASRVAS